MRANMEGSVFQSGGYTKSSYVGRRGGEREELGDRMVSVVWLRGGKITLHGWELEEELKHW